MKRGIVPIFEPGLDKMVKKNYSQKRLRFTTDIEEALKSSEIIFIAVGTPMSEDGSADLKYVLDVAKSVGRKMQKL